jgi:hypothetical protein
MPAGPESAGDTLDRLAALLDRVYNRIADWADGQPMAPASAAGIALILGICAAAWFTAGTRNGNLCGAAALAAGYLVTLGSREFLYPAAGSAAGLAHDGLAAGRTAGLAAGTSAARAGWLSTLGTRLAEYAVYVGLAIGAAGQGWHGTWPLTIAVLGLAAVCDTMTVCSRRLAGRPAAADLPAADLPAAVRRIPAGIEPDDTIPDVPAWDGTAPDAMAPDGSVLLGRTTGLPAHDDLPRPASAGARRAGDTRAGGSEPEHLGLGGLAGRVLLAALTMPPGGRVLLVVVAAPIFGAQLALVALLDWGIIAVGFGIGSRTAARRRNRKADERFRDLTGGRAEPGSLAVLLLPARPAESSYWPADLPPGAELPPAEDADLDRAAYASELAAAASFDSAALAGDPSVGAALGLAYPGDAVYDWADDDWADDNWADGDWADGAEPGSARPDGAAPDGGPAGRAGVPGRPATETAEVIPPGSNARVSRGPATDAELADQDEWDAELAASRPRPLFYPAAGALDAADERPTLAERLGLGRPPELAGPQRPYGAPDGGLDADSNGASGHDPDDGPGDAAAPGEPARARNPGSSGAPGSTGPDSTGPDSTGPEDATAGRRRATVLRNRDDGTLARWFGRLARGQLMPLPPALLALAAVAVLAHLGLRDLPGLLILAPALVMLVAAPGASHQHDGPFDWLVPAVLQGAQYVYIAALGFAAGVPAPITFLLCVTIALHYADIGSAGSPVLLAARRAGSPLAARRAASGHPAAARSARSARSGRPRRSFQQRLGRQQPDRRQPGPAPAGPSAGPRQPATELGTWMGWEGRMIVVGLGAAMGVAVFAYLALAGYLSYLIGRKMRAGYIGLRAGGVR